MKLMLYLKYGLVILLTTMIVTPLILLFTLYNHISEPSIEIKYDDEIIYQTENHITHYKQVVCDFLKQKYGNTQLIITGNKLISTQEIYNLLLKQQNTCLYLTKLQQIQKQLIEYFDWIYKVELKRNKINLIQINLLEYQPKLLFVDKVQQVKYLLTDKKGLISCNKQALENLCSEPKFIQLICLDLSCIEKAHDLLKIINVNSHNINIKQLELVSNRRWNVMVDNILVKLPQKNWQIKWKQFLKINQDAQFKSKNIKIVDLRNKNNFFVEFYNH